MSSFIPATIDGKNYTIGEHKGQPVMFRESEISRGEGSTPDKVLENLTHYFREYKHLRAAGKRKEPLRFSEYKGAAKHFNDLVKKRLRTNIAMSENTMKNRNQVSVCIIPEVFILRKAPTEKETAEFVDAGGDDTPLGKWCAERGYMIMTTLMFSPDVDYTIMFAVISPTIARVEKMLPERSKKGTSK
jgi:hypothetical protein